MMRVSLVIAAPLLALAVCGCGSATASAPASTVPAVSPMPLPTGNGAEVAPPSDEPAAIASLSRVPSCGAIVSFEVDPDISPAPTAPGPVTASPAADAALQCLMAAWNAKAQASLVTDETTDEQDRIYTIYRLPGDGSANVMVRLDSHTEKTVTWTETTCRSLGLQDGRVTPSDCETEHSIR